MSTSLMRLSRGAIATLAVLLAACSGGGSTDGGDGDGLDFVPPSIDILTPEDTTTVVDRAQPLEISVDVADNLELRRVRTQLFDGLDQIFSKDTTFLGAEIIRRHIMTGTADISDRDVGKLMHLIVTAFDAAGNQLVDTLPFLTTSVGAPPVEIGPTVRLEMPNDTIMYPGREVRFRVTALDPNGIAQITDTIRGSGLTTTVLNHDVVTSPLLDSLSIDTVYTIPANTQLGTNIYFVGVARDGNGQYGNVVRRRFIIERQPGDTLGPLVFQTVPLRLEDSASFTVRAEDQSPVRRFGYRVTTAAGAHIDSGSVVRTTGLTSVATHTFHVRFGPQYRGQTVIVYSFADDTAGNRGYSVASNVTVPQMTAANARVDRPLLVFGRTFQLPAGGSGADIAVDTTRRNVYVSNFAQNRLESWSFGNASAITRLSPVLVGSQPWGMALEIGGTRLLVANSGGTNLDVIDLVSRTQVARYSTPNTRLWYINESVNTSDGLVKYTGEYYDYSDRPQYVAMSENGNIYFSTRPTASAPEGTIRRIDPDVPGELEQIWQYGDESPLGEYSVINADAVTIFVGGTGVSDEIQICDHAVGAAPSTICFRGNSVTNVAAQVRAAGGDAVAERVTAESLALTDTTFVAVGGDRKWVAFGEGNTAGRPGRIMMVHDPLGSTTLDATPGISVRDLTDNASDRVTGVAINNNSSTVGVHGAEAYFAEISDDFRFQLRLQGKFATSGTGSGIVFHPENDGTSNDTNRRRVSFVAAGEPKVQIIDSYFFRMRGELELRAPLRGPIRAINPTAAEAAAGVVVKLFGLSADGLVIIDVLNCDIAP